jgi:hypothetical protein
MNNGHTHENITSIDSWFDDIEVVTLPSGRNVGLRQVDVLYILSDEGEIPNFLLDQIGGHISGEAPDVVSEAKDQQVSMEDMEGIKKLLDRLVFACWAKPPVSNDPAKIEAREAIGTHMIALQDKFALLTWAMGGETAVEASRTFPEKQSPHLEPVPAVGEIPPPTESDHTGS